VRYLKTALIGGIAFYAMTVTVLWAFQRDLMYFPDASPRVPPSYYEMLDGVQEASFTTADGIELVAWYAPAPPLRPTVVMFHGNGGSLRGERYRLKHFKDAGLGALLVAYRGYSGNAGTRTSKVYTPTRARRSVGSTKTVSRASRSCCTASRSAPASQRRWPPSASLEPWCSKRRIRRRST
jgi:hypothetical protein